MTVELGATGFVSRDAAIAAHARARACAPRGRSASGARAAEAVAVRAGGGRRPCGGDAPGRAALRRLGRRRARRARRLRVRAEGGEGDDVLRGIDGAGPARSTAAPGRRQLLGGAAGEVARRRPRRGHRRRAARAMSRCADEWDLHPAAGSRAALFDAGEGTTSSTTRGASAPVRRRPRARDRATARPGEVDADHRRRGRAWRPRARTGWPATTGVQRARRRLRAGADHSSGAAATTGLGAPACDVRRRPDEVYRAARRRQATDGGFACCASTTARIVAGELVRPRRCDRIGAALPVPAHAARQPAGTSWRERGARRALPGGTRCCAPALPAAPDRSWPGTSGASAADRLAS